MKLEVHRYALKSRAAAALNARSGRSEFPGALIRMDGVGVGCVHPWPELGDASLEEELTALASGRPLQLGRCALVCAAWDSLARREKRSLFAGLSIPDSHWTVGHRDDPAAVVKQGFSVAKLKIGPDVRKSVAEVERWASSEGLKNLRLDANESLTPAEFGDFSQQLSDAARHKVEFVEDPTPVDAEQWRQQESETGLVLALDRAADGALWTGVRIVKPARCELVEIDKLLKNKAEKVIFTSYMDHAIGQAWAAFVAAKYAHHPKVSPHAGLMTHPLFEPDSFFERLRCEGPRLLPPAGTGLGFDDLLDKLPWTPLN